MLGCYLKAAVMPLAKCDLKKRFERSPRKKMWIFGFLFAECKFIRQSVDSWFTTIHTSLIAVDSLSHISISQVKYK